MKTKKSPSSKNTAVLGRPKDAAKRAGIVRAATSLFMKEGYAQTSMEAVARKADVSKLTIYSHFRNKDELFKAVIRQRCDDQAMPDSFLDMAKLPVEKALLEIGNRMVALIFKSDSLCLHRIMQSEITRYPQVVKIFYEAGPQRVRKFFAELLEDFNRQGQLTIKDTTKATEQFFSLLKGEMLNRIMLHQAPCPSAKQMKAHVQATVDFFLSYYKPRSKS